MKPHALVTNDDGIDSAFLKHLVEALLPVFRVSVAAPASEQSWIGRAMTRRGEIEVRERVADFGGAAHAWAIGGTPSDCVNIALGNLLESLPDIVLSGINIGYNTTETLILCSGTIAGAVEGAQWGLPAVAFSKTIPNELFKAIRVPDGEIPQALDASLRTAAEHAARIAKDSLATPTALGTVVNINFPFQTFADTEIRKTYPAKIKLGSLFEATAPGKYRFAFRHGIPTETDPNTDRAALAAGYISRSVLDFSRVGEKEFLLRPGST
jgi:5'-nucleotidase